MAAQLPVSYFGVRDVFEWKWKQEGEGLQDVKHSLYRAYILTLQ